MKADMGNRPWPKSVTTMDWLKWLPKEFDAAWLRRNLKGETRKRIRRALEKRIAELEAAAN